jgi:hypothetical protein
MTKQKWYVFDEWDCIESAATATEAASIAQRLADNGFTGVEIRLLTLAEFNAYCQGGQAALNKLRDCVK